MHTRSALVVVAACEQGDWLAAHKLGRNVGLMGTDQSTRTCTAVG